MPSTALMLVMLLAGSEPTPVISYTVPEDPKQPSI